MLDSTKQFFIAIRTTIVLAMLTGLIFPGLVFVLAHLLFPFQSEGSLLTNDQGLVIGSELIGQNFQFRQYFHPRPSASNYAAEFSCGTNLGPISSKLIAGLQSFAGIKQLAVNYRKENNLDPDVFIPVDAVTRSGSGLDPHISLENAFRQAPRISLTRNQPLSVVLDRINSSLDRRQFGILGESGVNVLKANLSLDRNSHYNRINSNNLPIGK